jgi:hypothetical protein
MEIVRLEILRFLTFASLAAGIVGVLLGSIVNYKWYWLAILALYDFSFLTGFTIGLNVLAAVWILLALAIGHSLGWITNRKRAFFASLLGLAIWLPCVLAVDDYWLFFPLRQLYKYAGLL